MAFYHPLLQEFNQPVYFFTSTILNWLNLLQEDRFKLIIMDSLKFMVDEKRIVLYGFVIMPNHIHLVFTTNEFYDLSSFKRDFGKYTAQHIKMHASILYPGEFKKHNSTQGDRAFQIWERRPLTIPIYNMKTLNQKINYIHQNPCKSKKINVLNPEDYYFSSARFYNLGEDDWGFITHYMN